MFHFKVEAVSTPGDRRSWRWIIRLNDVMIDRSRPMFASRGAALRVGDMVLAYVLKRRRGASSLH